MGGCAGHQGELSSTDRGGTTATSKSMEVGLAEAAKAVEGMEDVDDNNIEDVDDSEWDNDVAIDL